MGSRRPPRRRCKGRNKRGKPCRAAPLKGGEHCRAHDPMQPDETRFGSSIQAGVAGASEKPRVPRVTEMLQQKIEERAEEILAVYEDALAAMRGIVVGRGEDATLEMVPDHFMRLKAAEAALNRVYGKPKQTQEITGAGGGPIEHSLDFSDPETRRLAHQLVVRRAGRA